MEIGVETILGPQIKARGLKVISLEAFPTFERIADSSIITNGEMFDQEFLAQQLANYIQRVLEQKPSARLMLPSVCLLSKHLECEKATILLALQSLVKKGFNSEINGRYILLDDMALDPLS